VAAWAAANDIPEDRWLAPSRGLDFFRGAGEAAAPRPPNISQLAELYNFFDQLPIEDLLELNTTS